MANITLGAERGLALFLKDPFDIVREIHEPVQESVQEPVHVETEQEPLIIERSPLFDVNAPKETFYSRAMSYVSPESEQAGFIAVLKHHPMMDDSYSDDETNMLTPLLIAGGIAASAYFLLKG